MPELVVRGGTIEESTSLDRGPLVYRDDTLFEGFIRSTKTTWYVGILLTAIGVSSFLFFLVVTDYHISAQVGVILMVAFLFVIHISFRKWSKLERGVGIYRNGVDMVRGGPRSVSMVFVPWDEIGGVVRNSSVTSIELRHSGEYLICSSELVDDKTLYAIGSMKERAEELSEPPDLHLYPKDGKRKEESTYERAPGSPK